MPSDEDNDDENDPLDISLSSSCSGNTVTVASRGDPVSGASVRVDGTLMEATGSNGQMSFKGCDDTVEIRASKSGYETEEKNFQLISCSACEEPEQNDTNQTEPEPQFECYSNSDCPITDYCLIPAGAAGGTCEPVIPGSCGEVKNHSFVPFGYECGNETGCPACPGGQICQEHACVSYNLTGPANVTLNSTANIVATKEGGPCILCEIIVTDPAGRTFGGRTDEKGLFTLPTPLRGIYIVSLIVDGQVYKSIQIIAVPGEAPVEPQKPPVTTPQEEFPWWLLILVLLIILGIAYWRRRKRGREPAARGKQ